MPAILLWSNGFLINIFHDLVSGWLNAEYSSTPEKRFPLLLGVICIKIPFCLSFSLSSYMYHFHRGSKKNYEYGSGTLLSLPCCCNNLSSCHAGRGVSHILRFSLCGPSLLILKCALKRCSLSISISLPYMAFVIWLKSVVSMKCRTQDVNLKPFVHCSNT